MRRTLPARRFRPIEAGERGHNNVSFEVRDAARLADEAGQAAFDLITTFDAVHDQKDPLAVLRGIRGLQPDRGA